MFRILSEFKRPELLCADSIPWIRWKAKKIEDAAYRMEFFALPKINLRCKSSWFSMGLGNLNWSKWTIKNKRIIAPE